MQKNKVLNAVVFLGLAAVVTSAMGVTLSPHLLDGLDLSDIKTFTPSEGYTVQDNYFPKNRKSMVSDNDIPVLQPTIALLNLTDTTLNLYDPLTEKTIPLPAKSQTPTLWTPSTEVTADKIQPLMSTLTDSSNNIIADMSLEGPPAKPSFGYQEGNNVTFSGDTLTSVAQGASYMANDSGVSIQKSTPPSTVTVTGNVTMQDNGGWVTTWMDNKSKQEPTLAVQFPQQLLFPYQELQGNYQKFKSTYTYYGGSLTFTSTMMGAKGLGIPAGALQGEQSHLPYVIDWWVVERKNPFTPEWFSSKYKNINLDNIPDGSYIVTIRKIPKATIPTGGVNHIFVFGDSLSDIGRNFNSSNGGTPRGAYYDGRYSNGGTWVDALKQLVGIPTDDYAFGGAEIIPVDDDGKEGYTYYDSNGTPAAHPFHSFNATALKTGCKNMAEQVVLYYGGVIYSSGLPNIPDLQDEFQAALPSIKKALDTNAANPDLSSQKVAIVVLMGGNDYKHWLGHLFDASTSTANSTAEKWGIKAADTLMDNLTDLNKTLINDGYPSSDRVFIIQNAPDFKDIPVFAGDQADAHSFTESFNQELGKWVPPFSFKIFDLHSLLQYAINNPEQYGFLSTLKIAPEVNTIWGHATTTPGGFDASNAAGYYCSNVYAHHNSSFSVIQTMTQTFTDPLDYNNPFSDIALPIALPPNSDSTKPITLGAYGGDGTGTPANIMTYVDPNSSDIKLVNVITNKHFLYYRLNGGSWYNINAKNQMKGAIMPFVAASGDREKFIVLVLDNSSQKVLAYFGSLNAGKIDFSDQPFEVANSITTENSVTPYPTIVLNKDGTRFILLLNVNNNLYEFGGTTSNNSMHADYHQILGGAANGGVGVATDPERTKICVVANSSVININNHNQTVYRLGKFNDKFQVNWGNFTVLTKVPSGSAFPNIAMTPDGKKAVIVYTSPDHTQLGYIIGNVNNLVIDESFGPYTLKTAGPIIAKPTVSIFKLHDTDKNYTVAIGYTESGQEFHEGFFTLPADGAGPLVPLKKVNSVMFSGMLHPSAKVHALLADQFAYFLSTNNYIDGANSSNPLLRDICNNGGLEQPDSPASFNSEVTADAEAHSETRPSWARGYGISGTPDATACIIKT